MPRNYFGGFSVIWLLILILASTIPLLKVVSEWQSKISAPAEEKYLSDGTRFSFADLKNTHNWNTHVNGEYKYQIKYPKYWNLKTNFEVEDPSIIHRERVLAEKIDVTITIYSKFNPPEKKGKIKAGKNEFSYIRNSINKKIVYIEKNKLFYIVELSQVNFFKNPDQFEEMFELILKNLEFTK